MKVNVMMLFNAIRKNKKAKRQKLHTKKAKKVVSTYQEPLKVNNKSSFTKNTHLGANTHFNGIMIRGDGYVTVGDNFHSAAELVFITRFHNYDTGKAIPYDDTYIQKDITIEDNVWIGYRCIVLGGGHYR